jgi:hypothetical protein
VTLIWRTGVLMGSGWACCAIPAVAADVVQPPGGKLNSVVVTGQRPSVPDSELKEQVEAAMRNDPFVPDQHVTVTIKDGVITLHGFVFDEWDLRVVKRIARKTPGVKRVIDDLEIELGGE